jgi:ectoine hydroxylase-related dioxygenase (phytanoyl-CoA dioxygenase family)
MNESLTTQIEKNGFAVLPQVFTDPEVKSIRDDLARAFLPSADVDPTIRRRNGVVYAARNVLSLFPATAGLWRKPEILALLRDVLGADFGLVRVLFFDKPPERTWTLPWHKDVTIAIAEPEPNSGFEREVLRKVGIPHIEAPRSVLDGMLTIRLHLDDVTEENGCMYVVPGSHKIGAVDHSEPWMVGQRRDMKIPDSAIDLQRERAITLRAGGCSFHHGLIQHRSGANRTDHFRRGLATHYMTSRSQWTGDAHAKPEYHLLHGREYENCV